MNEQSPEDNLADAELTPIEKQKPPALLLSNKTYDVLKPLVTVVLPAAQVFYVALAALWGWGLETEISGTIAATNAFLGAVVGLSARSYNNSDAKFDGIVQIQDDPIGQVVNVGYGLTAPDPRLLADKKEIVLKVVPPEE